MTVNLPLSFIEKHSDDTDFHSKVDPLIVGMTEVEKISEETSIIYHVVKGTLSILVLINKFLHRKFGSNKKMLHYKYIFLN